MINKGHINKLALFYSLFGLRGIIWAAKTALSGKEFEFSVTDKSLLSSFSVADRQMLPPLSKSCDLMTISFLPSSTHL
jgi:hypothetical protein